MAVIIGFLWQQPDGVLVLESRWVMEELAALTVSPWLAIIAIAASVAVPGKRAHWIATAGAGIGILSIALPSIAARFVETRVVSVVAPDWTGHGGIAGGLYVLAVFGLVGLAIIVVREPRSRPSLNIAVVAAIGISGLLLWRIQIMRFNGDEPHYYVTAWSLGDDHDLELLNNYVSERYQSLTYSPVGNIALERDASTNRYAAAAPGPEGSWFLIPPLEDGWTAPDDATGLIEAADRALVLDGPDGARATVPALVPGRNHAIIVEEPCRVPSVYAGLPPGTGEADLTVTVLDRDGAAIWQAESTVDSPVTNIEIPESSGLCAGSGNWTVRVDASREILAEAVDRYNGMQIAGGDLRQGWIFGGLPRDRYGSTEVASRLLLHNPTGNTLQTTVRLVTSSDQTTSEITIGLGPGQTVIEPLPVFGATTVVVRVTEEAEISAGLYGIVDGNRYRIPPLEMIGTYSIELSADSTHDAGLWLTMFNPSPDAATATIDSGTGTDQLSICGLCAETALVRRGGRATRNRIRRCRRHCRRVRKSGPGNSTTISAFLSSRRR
ncbi:MAG: hypothetical protein R2849_10565 [Thermomicrobiales bacterium]